MTQQPPDERTLHEARVRRALVKNIAGAALVVLAAIVLGFALWSINPWLLVGAVAAAVGALGYQWATSEVT